MRKHWLFALALMAMGSVLAAPAAEAQANTNIERLVAAPGEVDTTPTAWLHIGANPLTVSPTVIGAAHARYTDVSEAEVLKAVAMQSRGECIQYQLKDGDVLRNGFGKGQSLLTRVAFGQNVSEGDTKRSSSVCIVREDGTAVVLPHGCGNWSVARVVYRQQAVTTPRTPVRIRRSYAAEKPTVSQNVSNYNPQPTTLFLLDSGCGDCCE